VTRHQALAYVLGWTAACLVAVVLYAREPRAHAITREAYWRFLLAPWKVATFLVAAAGITGIAPYTGDPTWDYVDAAFMALFAFTTAPWAVGTIYQGLRGRRPTRHVFVAACVALFSASWSYDLYLWLRDGWYPVTWWANLFASSVLYACAGLFWSLEWQPGQGLGFAFTDPGWPATAAPSPFRRVFWPALVFMALVSLMILPFLWRR